MQGAKPIAQFKVILVGDIGVGKTTFANRQIPNQTHPPIIAYGYPTTQLLFYTNFGLIKLILIYPNSHQIASGIRQDFYLDCHAAIIMFDVTSQESYKNVPNWYRDIRKVKQDIPIVLAGNKIDIKQRKIKQKHIVFHRKKNIPYYDISAKANYQYQKPFIFILKRLIANSNLQLLEHLKLKPSQFYIDSIETNQMQKNCQQINSIKFSQQFVEQ